MPLSSGLTTSGLSAAVAIVLVLRYFYRRYTSPLAKAPLAETNNFWLANFGLVPPPSDTEDKLSEFLIKVGQDQQQIPVSVVWSVMGTPTVLVNTLQGIKDVLIDGQAKRKGKNLTGPPTNVQRGDFIRLIQNLVFGGPSINNTVGEDWRWRRHVLLPPFQPRQLVPNLLPYVSNRAKQLLDLFEKHAEQNTAVELDEVFMNLTMDVINYYLYGRSDLNYEMVGGRTNLKNVHHHLGMGFMSVEAWLPFGLNKTDWAQRNFQGPRALLKDFINDSLDRALADKESKKGDGVFHSVAAAAVASGNYNDPERFDLINDFLSLTFAGYDTTAHTLAFCFSELARHPEIQDKIVKQVRQVLGPPPVDPASITAEKLAQMPYVTAVYRETMRKYPAVAFIPVHVNHDTPVDGTVVPGGAEIWCNLRGLQMNPAMFPNPEKFDPSRWLKPAGAETDDGFDRMVTSSSSHTIVDADHQYNFPDLSFTLGQHSCLGKNLAILELRTVIACTVNQYSLSLKPGNNINTKIVLTTKPRDGVWVHFKKRS
ncbi:cytochrome P450 [Zychaea mexicana]|uniref:cytochrome P450 n=1 Tax=Zychaea mexicana TaxID=64656 RepID=UPI0022FDFE58|nr:cytochrome P450 [Zychaea mexicana]KAI9490797.1 cytochrome P450 [Zychaea mexicana]